MKLIRVRCTNCGADFDNVEAGQTVFHCTRMGCGATFVVEQGRKFSDADPSESEKIQKLRLALKQSLSPFDRKQANLYASQILALVPEDFRAQTVLCLCELKQGKPRALRRLLENRVECTESEFLEMFPFILQAGEYRELMLLEGAVEWYISDPQQISELKCQIVDRKEEIRISSDRYADIPRDVFICHSSVQQDLAMQVVDALEKDGNLCWISCRNLLPDAPDYWREIERAVSRCRIFLVLASEAAMLSRDVQAELRYAERNRNLRLELKLDDTPHTTQFKYFFNGITWVKAETDWQAALPELKRRVYLLLHGETKEAESKAESPHGAETKDVERPTQQSEPVKAVQDQEQSAAALKEHEHHGVWYADEYVKQRQTEEGKFSQKSPEPAQANPANDDVAAQQEASVSDTRRAGEDVEVHLADSETGSSGKTAKAPGRKQFWLGLLITAIAFLPECAIAWAHDQKFGAGLGRIGDIEIGMPECTLLALLPYAIAALLASRVLLLRSERPRRLQALFPLLPIWAEGVFFAVFIAIHGLYVGSRLSEISISNIRFRLFGLDGGAWEIIFTIWKGLALCISAIGIWLTLRKAAVHPEADGQKAEEEKASPKTTALFGFLFALVLCDLFYGCYSTLANQRMLTYLLRDVTYDLSLIAILFALKKLRKPRWLSAMIAVLPRIVSTILIIYLINDQALRYVGPVLSVINQINIIEPFLLLYGLVAVLFFGWTESHGNKSKITG